MRIIHCTLYVLINISNVQAFSRVTTAISKSRTQLYALDPIVEAYKKKAPVVDITADIALPNTPPPEVTSAVPPVGISQATPDVNLPEIGLNGISSYLDKSVNDAKVAASQAASAASELMKQAPAIDGKNAPILRYFDSNIPPLEDGKVYNMFEYLKSLNRQDTPGFSLTVNQERVDTLMGNIMGYRDTVLYGTEKAATTPEIMSIADHLQEYFPWYVAGFAVLYSVSTKNNARVEMKQKYEEELEMYKARAEEAAAAAMQAAEGAKSVKDAVLASSNASEKTVSSTVSKLKELQEDKEITKKEIAKLVDDLQSLQQKFDVLLSEKEALEAKLATPLEAVDEALFSDETVETVQNAKEDEDDTILEVLKEMEELKSLESDKGMIEIEAEEKATKTKTKRPKSAKTAKGSKSEEKKPVAEKKATKRKSKVKESIIVENEEPIIVVQEEKPAPKEAKSKEDEEPFFAAIEEKVESTENIVKHPWSKLSQSTLNRKTVKELSDFLEERGVAYVDDSGKPLAKKVLVSSVQEYL